MIQEYYVEILQNVLQKFSSYGFAIQAFLSERSSETNKQLSFILFHNVKITSIRLSVISASCSIFAAFCLGRPWRDPKIPLTPHFPLSKATPDPKNRPMRAPSSAALPSASVFDLPRRLLYSILGKLSALALQDNLRAPLASVINRYQKLNRSSEKDLNRPSGIANLETSIILQAFLRTPLTRRSCHSKLWTGPEDQHWKFSQPNSSFVI